MSDEETGDRTLTYAGEYARRRAATDPEFRERRRETNRLYYQRRKADPAFMEAKREQNRENAARRAAARPERPKVRRSRSPDIDAHIGRWIRERRKVLRITTAVAAAHVGVTPPMYAMYERGDATMTVGTLHALAELLGVTVADFFHGLNDGRPAPVPAGPPEPATPEEVEIAALAQAIPPRRRLALRQFLEQLAQAS